MIKMNEVTKVTILITLTNLGTRRSGRVCQGTLGAVHILRNMLWGGGGLPYLLQYYIGGGLLNLLQYYIGAIVKIYYNITVLKGKWKVIILFQL